MVALGTCCNGKRKKSKHLHLSYFEDKLQVNAAVSAIQNKTLYIKDIVKKIVKIEI